ncbi:ASCH domain-containing protein [Candidatus Bipolaricaulota bacterium]|nr:ASCH domain-containing protein [Candidatus Bipolaricaulota bacterium]
MTRRWLLISVKPEYAAKMFTGKKTAELRRVRPAVTRGDWVLVYASSPRKAILGAFQVETTLEGSPGDLWEICGECTAVSRRAFNEYFEGSRLAFAILMAKAQRFAEPFLLEQIREHLPTFHPPQSYAYLDEGSQTGDALLDLVAPALELIPAK